MYSIVLRIIPRLVALFILWESLSLVLPPIVFGGSQALLQLLSRPEGLLIVLSAVMSLFTIATGSVTVYTVSLLLLVLGKGFVGYVATPAPFIGLGILLVSDTVALSYREGQSKSLEMGFKRASIGIVALVIVFAVSVGVAVYSGYALAYIVLSIVNLPRGVSGAGVVLANLLANPFVRLLVFVFAALYLYKVVSTAMDVVLMFMKPSRKLSLAVLRDKRDIDVAIEYPLQTLFSIILAFAIAPVIYEFINSIIKLIPVPMALDWRFGITLSVITYMLSTILMYLYFRWLTAVDVKVKNIVIPATLAVMVYITAVLASIGKGFTVTQALMNPDFGEVDRGAYMSYVNFYTSFFFLLDVLSRLIGVAP